MMTWPTLDQTHTSKLTCAISYHKIGMIVEMGVRLNVDCVVHIAVDTSSLPAECSFANSATRDGS